MKSHDRVVDIPTQQESFRILEANNVPPHILRHSVQVAKIAKYLAEELASGDEPGVDPALVEAAALLHDIAKAACFESRKDHALEGAHVLKNLGFDAIADLVERHVRLGQWDVSGSVTAAEILNYSDKRVQHEEIVSLDERFADILNRYGKLNPEAHARCEEYWRTTKALEKKIFDNLSFGPEELSSRLG